MVFWTNNHILDFYYFYGYDSFGTLILAYICLTISYCYGCTVYSNHTGKTGSLFVLFGALLPMLRGNCYTHTLLSQVCTLRWAFRSLVVCCLSSISPKRDYGYRPVVILACLHWIGNVIVWLVWSNFPLFHLRRSFQL